MRNFKKTTIESSLVGQSLLAGSKGLNEKEGLEPLLINKMNVTNKILFSDYPLSVNLRTMIIINNQVRSAQKSIQQ